MFIMMNAARFQVGLQGIAIGERAYQTTDTKALEALCEYLKDPTSTVWLGTVEEIATYVQKQRAVTRLEKKEDSSAPTVKK
jgi:hypothetical protein